MYSLKLKLVAYHQIMLTKKFDPFTENLQEVLEIKSRKRCRDPVSPYNGNSEVQCEWKCKE